MRAADHSVACKQAARRLVEQQPVVPSLEGFDVCRDEPRVEVDQGKVCLRADATSSDTHWCHIAAFQPQFQKTSRCRFRCRGVLYQHTGERLELPYANFTLDLFLA